MKKRISLIGYGALSKLFLDIFRDKLSDYYVLNGIYTRHTPEDCTPYRFYTTMDQLLSDQPDLVIEFAGVQAVREYGEAVLRRGYSLVVVSIGALADDMLYLNLIQAAEEHGGKLHLASGAIGGFDILRTMALAGVDTVEIENNKAPGSLNGAPGLQGQALPLDRPFTAFEGSAREAIIAFPKNVNVAVATALAAADPDQTRVIINSIPGVQSSTHIIRAKNRLATVSLDISSVPDPSNPRSSTITAWSVAALLLNLCSPVQFF